MADPGFPIERAPIQLGSADARRGSFLSKNVCKNERIGSHWVGGGLPGSATDNNFNVLNLPTEKRKVTTEKNNFNSLPLFPQYS